MEESFGTTSGGLNARLYTISCGDITAKVTDYGAALVSLLCPDREGCLADVVLGYDDAAGYEKGTCFLGAAVGRSANRLRGASFQIGERTYHIPQNENGNNLHSGPDTYHTRLWAVKKQGQDFVEFFLRSPAGDQGYPGNADITVTYRLAADGGLHIVYDAVCDEDTVFNMTNHAYFNLAGQEKKQRAMEQVLIMPARHFCPDDAANIPTGECRSVAGTPMDFRFPKAIGRDINCDYEPLHLQGGYDHNWEVFCNPCAILADPESGRELAVYTDCPGIQLYAGNYLEGSAKGGGEYPKRSGIALETQFYPDAMHKDGWKKPIVKKGERYHSETIYRFTVNK